MNRPSFATAAPVAPTPSAPPAASAPMSGFRALVRSALLLALALPVAGCAVLSGPQRDPVTLYAPQLVAQADPSWPRAEWQLAIAPPPGSGHVDGSRIGVRAITGPASADALCDEADTVPAASGPFAAEQAAGRVVTMLLARLRADRVEAAQ